jgi:6-phosphogluconolactonase
MDKKTKVNIFPDKDELSVALTQHVAHLAEIASARQGRFTVAFSGGSLIKIISLSLCSEPLLNNIDWSRWYVFWVDERWVPWSSPESNYGLAKDLFFSRVSIPHSQIYGADNSLDPSTTAKNYESVLTTVFQPKQSQIPRFDLILLGIGEDGHTASLFPDHPLLAETMAWVAPIFNAPKPPSIRITMTLPIINNARNIFFVAAGSSKADILSTALNPKRQQGLPVQLVNPSDGELQWFIDRTAAGGGSVWQV